MSLASDLGPTRAEILLFIADENWQAKREVCVVRIPGPHPSGWDKRHQHLNDLLDDLEYATG